MGVLVQFSVLCSDYLHIWHCLWISPLFPDLMLWRWQLTALQKPRIDGCRTLPGEVSTSASCWLQPPPNHNLCVLRHGSLNGFITTCLARTWYSVENIIQQLSSKKMPLIMSFRTRFPQVCQLRSLGGVIVIAVKCIDTKRLRAVASG